jgi:hypothetical protein
VSGAWTKEAGLASAIRLPLCLTRSACAWRRFGRGSRFAFIETTMPVVDSFQQSPKNLEIDSWIPHNNWQTH